MAQYPNPIENREELNLRLGIKSSLYNLRSVVASLYSMYVATGKPSHIDYTEEVSSNGVITLKMHSSIKSAIVGYFNDSTISDKIEASPLFKAQIESLQVGLELFFHLAKVSFNKQGLSERTGSNRYNKCLDFSTNVLQLDLLFSSFPDSEVKAFLSSWIAETACNTELEKKVLLMLSVFSEDTQCKIRTKDGNEIYFQREGIYKLLTNGESVVSEDAKELVGPYRILKSYVSSGMHPFLREKNKEFQSITDKDVLSTYAEMVSTMLDLSPRRQMIVQEEIAVKSDVSFNHDSNQPLQQIFYGAPGTGKSYQIDDMTKNESVIRTTFHPDSDYSTFVGCYKPTTSKNKPDHLSYEELVEKLKDYKSRMDQSRACTMLGFQYPDSVKEIDEQGKIWDLLKAVGITTGNYDTSIRCGWECYQTAKTNTSAITYEYVPQAFIQAYIKAWKFYQENPENPKKQYLIIEEINRGNCAQIFGDLFQLLDRNDQDLSSYSIVPDKDLQKHIADYGLKVTGILNNAETEDISDKINSGEILCLPSNLYIWATMNTSDQSLFPIDSAFKRRWEWKYMKIANMEKGYKIEVNGKHYDWWKFIDKMNTIIGAATSSEDKKLGYFFCKVKEGTTDITAEQFVSKVLFYIYGDALKDYDIKDDAFKKEEKDGKKIYYTFSDFYDAKGNVDKEMVAKLLDTFVGADEKATNEENQAKDENTAE